MLTLLTALTLTLAALITALPLVERLGDVCYCEPGPGKSGDNQSGGFCGWQWGAVNGNCNPNNIYWCSGDSGFAEMIIDCPSVGLSCKDGMKRGDDPQFGTDYCDI
jgi:hypothetical protein